MFAKGEPSTSGFRLAMVEHLKIVSSKFAPMPVELQMFILQAPAPLLPIRC
jgi:hypothetical protein